MNIQPYIDFDQELLLKLNGSDSLFWDGFMWLSTKLYTWIPLAIILLYVIFKNNKPKYLVIDMENNDFLLDLTEDEKIDIVARRILLRYLPAFKELAK